MRALEQIPVPGWVTRLPKTDLHCHAEAYARLEQVRARESGRPALDWRRAAARAMTLPPGLGRLFALDGELDKASLLQLNESREYVIRRLALVMEEAASDGAVLIEIRLGQEILLMPDFMEAFREAASRCAEHHPELHAAAVVSINVRDMERSESRVASCVRAARQGLHGIDFLPYTGVLEADYAAIYRWARQALDAGLGITIHAGEFSTEGLALAARLPGLTRMGHGVFVPHVPGLIDELAERQIVVECCLSSNAVLGAVQTYEEHPIRELAAHGMRVTLATDNPAKLWTHIGREYAIAAAIGFSKADLLALTRNGIDSSYLQPGDKQALLSLLPSDD